MMTVEMDIDHSNLPNAQRVSPVALQRSATGGWASLLGNRVFDGMRSQFKRAPERRWTPELHWPVPGAGQCSWET